MPHVDLFEFSGLAVIIEWPSGLVYSNQTGGHSCLHPELQGALIPLRNDVEHPSGKLLSPETDLFAYFQGPPHDGTGATLGLSEADADFIDSVLRKWKLTHVRVDRARLSESHEAWVWVLVHEEPPNPARPLFHGFGPYPLRGVLVWTNTD